MTSDRLNLVIVFRTVLLVLTSAGLTWFVLVQLNYYVASAFLLALIAEIAELLHYVNSVNRKLAYFFDAIRNEDTTLKFPDGVHNKSLQALHNSLNNLNRLISDIKIRNETSQLFFRELIEHSSTGLMTLDPEGYVEVMNHTAKNYLGITHLAHIRLLKQKNPPMHEIISGIMPGEKRFVKLTTRQGLVNLAIRSSELKFGPRKYKLVSLQDIRHEMEENEIDSWQKLIRVMTHEIMNSIAPITSLTNTLSRIYKTEGRPKSPEELSGENIQNTLDGLGIIEERGKGLMHFVDNYRKITRIPEPVFSPLCLSDWMDGFALLFRSKCQELDVHFVCRGEKSKICVTTDEKMLNQVMINLMVNALDAVTAKFGKPTETSATTVPSNYSEAGAAEASNASEMRQIILSIRPTPGGGAIIDLTDNGCGIDEELMDKIFVPFFTTREGGSGIGLSLSRQIIRKLNGKLSARSVKGKGSSFIVEL